MILKLRTPKDGYVEFEETSIKKATHVSPKKDRMRKVFNENGTKKGYVIIKHDDKHQILSCDELLGRYKVRFGLDGNYFYVSNSFKERYVFFKKIKHQERAT